MIPNPWVIIGVIIFVISTYFYGHHKGWAERDAEMQAQIAVKNEEARVKEQKATEELNQTAIKLKDANDAISQKQSSIDSLIKSRRLFKPTPSCVQANASTAPPSGDSDQAGSELEQQTLRAIAEIVAQGDRNTAQLNACIDSYNAIRSQVNGQ